MREVTSYSTGALFSIVLHVAVVAALLANWESDSKKVIIQPQYIEAKIVELAPKKKPVAKPPKPRVDRAAKKREQDKRRAAEKKKAEAKGLAALKEKQRADREREKLEFAETLAQEQSDISAQEDERVANSFMQLIRQRLSDNWSRPPSARRDMETLLEIRLVPTGRIVGVTVVKSSGDIAFDRSVEQAAFKAEQFEEIEQLEPRLFEKHFRIVKVAFSPQDLRL